VLRVAFRCWQPAVTRLSLLVLAAALFAPIRLGAEAVAPDKANQSLNESNRVSLSSSGTAFCITGFEVSGSQAITPDEINRLMQPATGTNVSLAAIRRALVALQETYRERGYRQVTVTLPRQTLDHGVVRISIVEGPGGPHEPSPAANSVPKGQLGEVPSYPMRHFEVRGNTALTAEELDGIIGPLVGPSVTETAVRDALSDLRKAYDARGFTGVTVAVPEQVLLDGTVVINVQEGGNRNVANDRDSAVKNVEPSVAPVRSFEVRHYEVQGNTLLSPEIVSGIFTNSVGTNVTLAQIQKALGELQLAYRERGFATVSVGLPEQRLTNAVVYVEVTEGRLVDINIIGNRYFSSNNISRALPSLRTNSLLNSRVLQRELDIANQNSDRQIYPTIGPGPDPGTSALALRVKDRLPLHGRADVNNYNTPGTPDWRINTSLSYANLWQREHQLGVSYGFSPEEFKSAGLMSDYLLNRPLIANYGGYYRMPFGTAAALAEQIGASAGRFGYDEATRQYRLPPAGARPDLTFYASGSSSDTGVKYGPLTVITNTPLLTMASQDSGQNLTLNNSAGMRLNVPLTLDENHRFSFSGGLDAKYYSLDSYNTNNFIITTVVTNSQGSQTLRSVVPFAQPKHSVQLAYLPLALGADYFQSDKAGSFSASLGVSVNFLGQQKDSAAAAYSTNASPTYAKVNLSLTREQRLYQQWSLLVRANGQAASQPLISNEQFALGGVGSVRGYYEGDEYGDSGWFGSLELRTPFVSTQVPIWSGSVPAWLRGSIFFDGGQRFLLDNAPGSDSNRTMFGTGLSLSANINNHVDTRITVAWPLRNSPNTAAFEPRVYFSLGGQF